MCNVFILCQFIKAIFNLVQALAACCICLSFLWRDLDCCDFDGRLKIHFRFRVFL